MENNNERENDRKPDGVNISVSESETYSGDTGDSEENPKQQSRIEGAVRADGKKYVEKGSLNEAELIADKKRAKKAKSKDELTEEEKREERRAANRLSAFQSRQRRLSIIEDLQRTVATISQENANQQREIQELTAELQSARQENERLRADLAGLGDEEEESVSASSSIEPSGSERAAAPLRFNPVAVRLPAPGSNSAAQQGLSPAISSFLTSVIASGTISGEVLELLRELALIQQQQAVLRNMPAQFLQQNDPPSVTPPTQEHQHGAFQRRRASSLPHQSMLRHQQEQNLSLNQQQNQLRYAQGEQQQQGQTNQLQQQQMALQLHYFQAQHQQQQQQPQDQAQLQQRAQEALLQQLLQTLQRNRNGA